MWIYPVIQMETEETLIKRSRKYIVATFVAIILAWLIIWGDQLMIHAKPEAVDRQLQTELGGVTAPRAGGPKGALSAFFFTEYPRIPPQAITMLISGKAASGGWNNTLLNTAYTNLTDIQRGNLTLLRGHAAQLRKLLLERPRAVPPQPGSRLLWNLNRFRSSLYFHVLDRLRHDDVSEAVESALALTRDAWWSHAGWGVTPPDRAIGVLWELLQYPNLTEVQLRDLGERLDDIWSRDGGLLPFNTTRAVIRQLADAQRVETRTRWDHLRDAVVLFDTAAFKRRINEAAYAYKFRTRLSYDLEAEQLQNLLVDLKAWKRGLATGNMFNSIAQARHERLGVHPTASYLSHVGVIGHGEQSLEVMASRETIRRLVRTVIALRRWRLKHNDLPVELSDLVPDLLAAVPTDLMDGASLRYQRIDDREFELHSVGKNGTDDAGRTRYSKTDISFSWYDGADWIWPRLATKAEIKANEEEIERRYQEMMRKKLSP